MADRNVEALQQSLKVGTTADGDVTEIQPDGTLRLKGAATVWDDLVGSLIGRRLASSVGSLDYDWDENAISMGPNGDIDSSNDRIVFNFQYPHKAIVNGRMNLHIHWEQENATNREFTVEYRVQKNGDTKSAVWSKVIVASNTFNVFPYASGVVNQITPLVSVDMINAGLSPTVQFRLTRSDGNSGSILATFIDAHFESDGGGSNQEFVKTP